MALNRNHQKELFMMTRRKAIKTTVMATAVCAVLPAARAQQTTPMIAAPPGAGAFSVPPLPYAYDALEPHIDALTMQIHHDKHHLAYVTNLNKALAGNADLAGKSIETIMTDLNAVPEGIRTAVRNNGGGHFNHSLFWQMMKKGGGGEPKGNLAAAMEKKFGSFSGFKDEFTKAATGRFGSGWAWLALGPEKQVAIESSANQDTPWSAGKTPLLGIDVWEHAYYLKYQNRRADYVAAWFNVADWDFVAERFQKAMG
jgi:Fe-Mn family superoxide dismutase